MNIRSFKRKILRASGGIDAVRNYYELRREAHNIRYHNKRKPTDSDLAKAKSKELQAEKLIPKISDECKKLFTKNIKG